MNWLDIIIASVLVINLFTGLRTGLVRMVISFAGLILGVFLAGRYYAALAGRLTFIPSEKASDVVAYVIILVAVLAAAAIVSWIVGKVISATPLGWLDHVGGAVVGLITAGIFVGAILAIWTKYAGGGDIVSGSLLGRFLLDRFPLVLALLPGEFDTVRSFFK